MPCGSICPASDALCIAGFKNRLAPVAADPGNYPGVGSPGQGVRWEGRRKRGRMSSITKMENIRSISGA